MPDYKIITDSTTDLTVELIKELDIHIIPMTYTIGDRNYVNNAENPELAPHEFYNMLRDGKMSTTAQINVQTFKDVFSPYLEEGRDVLYICFSSALSSTINSARIAVTDLAEEYPDRKVVVVDSVAASLGEGLLVYLAVEQKRTGVDIDALADWINEKKYNVIHFFTVQDLNHLRRGGRLSSAAALVGTMLSIKPVLHVDDEGRLVPVTKIRGRRNSLDALVSFMEKHTTEKENHTVFLSHGDALDDAKYVEKLICEKFGVKRFVINEIGPVVGTHSGPGTIALFFVGNKR